MAWRATCPNLGKDDRQREHVDLQQALCWGAAAVCWGGEETAVEKRGAARAAAHLEAWHAAQRETFGPVDLVTVGANVRTRCCHNSPTHLLVRACRARRQHSRGARRLAPACTPTHVGGVRIELDELRRLPLRGARRVPLTLRSADLHETIGSIRRAQRQSVGSAGLSGDYNTGLSGTGLSGNGYGGDEGPSLAKVGELERAAAAHHCTRGPYRRPLRGLSV